jgi:ubiquinone/menaquinone biosynthesis C-methylase UbiE
MKVYETIAEYYDLIFEQDFKKQAKTCHKILEGLGKNKGLLLDIGCGTGGHLKAFKQLGYNVERIN